MKLHINTKSIIQILLLITFCNNVSFTQVTSSCENLVYREWDTYAYDYLPGETPGTLNDVGNVLIDRRREVFFNGYYNEDYIAENMPLIIVENGYSDLRFSGPSTIYYSALVIKGDSLTLFHCYSTYYLVGTVQYNQEEMKKLDAIVNSEEKKDLSLNSYVLVTKFDDCSFTMKQVESPEYYATLMRYFKGNFNYSRITNKMYR